MPCIVSIFLTLLVSLLAGVSMPAEAKVLLPDEHGLANDGFRHRDLHTATFLTRDPAGFIDGPNTYNYVGHNPWSAFDPHGLSTTLPLTTAEIGYVGEPSVSWNEPPMTSAGLNGDSGTVGAATPYGGSPDGGGPGATVDPVSEAVEIRPSSLFDDALSAYGWVSAISSGYYFGSDYLPGVFSAEYPEDYTPDEPEQYREPKLGSAAYNRDKAWDLVLFFTELPGKTVATAITLGGATDLTTGSEVTYDLEYGFGTSEVTPGSRWVAGALIILPMRSGGYVDDGIRVLTRKSESTVVRIGTRIETKTGTEMAENAAKGGAAPVRLGQAGESAIERATGLSKNSTPYIVNGRSRIPDFVKATDSNGTPNPHY